MTRRFFPIVFVVMLLTTTRTGAADFCVMFASLTSASEKKIGLGVKETSPVSGLIEYLPSLVFSSVVTWPR